MKMLTNLKTALKNPAEARFLKLTIQGEIPKELHHLIYLEELYLEGEFDQFTVDLQFFSQLKLLSINSSTLKVFPAEALKCPSLINLKVLAGLFQFLVLPLEVISELKFFTLKNTSLKQLPLEISQLATIEEMNLSENQLTDLPLSLCELKKLKRLNIDRNQFKTLPAIIKKCESLRYLSCDGNLFSDEEKERIQREFNLTPH